MFGHAHYVAVMRTKRAERSALRALDPMLRSRITPLLECPPRISSGCKSPKELETKLDDIVSDLSGWSGRTVFLDFSMLRQTVPHAVEIIAAQAARAGIRPVLVVSLKTGTQSAYFRSVQAVLSRHGSAICLRISPEELKSDSIGEMVENHLRRYGVSPVQVDLVIDRGGVDSGSVTYREFAHLIPWVDSWRTLTVLAGSFPKDLSGLARGKTHRLRRAEWRQWRDLESWPGRRPAFGDYSVQHVNFKEPVPAPNPSASVRYTIADDFFILRGEGIRNVGGPGPGQWNAWAQLLIEMPDFFGAGFSAGDRYIAERAANMDTNGTPQTWLQAAFSHHLTTAALQVAGRLEQVRRITETTTATNWTSVIDIDRPEATL
jgi:hypothetical protein